MKKLSRKDYEKAYREANKEKIQAYDREYKEANKEKILAQNRAYKKANKEKLKAQNKALYNTGKDGLIRVYYLPEEHYVGITNHISHRMGAHTTSNYITDGYEILGAFERAVDAHALEVQLHQRGYRGSRYNTDLDILSNYKHLLNE